jgi:hypothetical protein
MSTSEALAVVAAVVVAMFVGALAFSLVSLARTLRVLRATVEELRAQTLPLANELRDAVREASTEVERVDRLVTSAERLEGAVDSASRLAYRTFANPVVKAMALGTGVSRAAQRLRDSDSTDRATDRATDLTVDLTAAEYTEQHAIAADPAPERERDRRRRSRRAS